MSNIQTTRNKSRSCIILSQGPVPTPEHTKVEGGGLRCWGLAKGLKTNDPDLKITVAYHESYKLTKFTKEYQGVTVATWDIDNLSKLISDYDSVIVSYCMGRLSKEVVDSIRPNQQLVLDCYVPIYAEVSARGTADLEREYADFHTDVGNWSHVLQRGDIFLCASESQKAYYTGVLSALGRLNPATYGEDLLLIVPYGIYRHIPQPTAKPISALIKNPAAKKILWFGGIYPWFDLRGLVEAVKILNNTIPAELIIVGAKNPFNDHPDFIDKYDELVDYINTSGASGITILQDWVKFEERANWYLDSDIVVAINKEGEENGLAWRTRLVDYVWVDLPIITNGGDPLGEILLANKAALRFTGLSAEVMASDLKKAFADQGKLAEVQANVIKVRKNYYWDKVTKKLSSDIKTQKLASDRQLFGEYQQVVSLKGGGRLAKYKKVISKARMLPAYTRKYGFVNTYFAVRTTLNNQLNKIQRKQGVTPSIVMIAHQLDLSGAPYVFLDLTRALKVGTNLAIKFHTFNPSHKDNLLTLNRMGIKPYFHISKEIGIEFIKGDVVVLNTSAHSTPLKESLYGGLERGIISQLIWFIHEDEPELIFSPREAKRLEGLLKNNKIIMYIAAKKTTKNYQYYFHNVKNIRLQPYKYNVPERYQKVLSQNDFDKLSFILSGSIADGRKGQLPIFYSFKAFLDKYYNQNPQNYRDFEVVYVGLGNDFLSRQLLKHAPKLLGQRFKHYEIVSHERSSELMMMSNVTICYSLRECLPLFVFEGMAAGHPILRNDSSGMEEQLFVGKNGLYLDSHDFDQVVDTIETILNIKKTTSKQLANMSKYSNQIALAQANNSYKPIIKTILNNFNQQDQS